MFENKDITYWAIIVLLISITIVALNLWTYSQYQKGFKAGVEYMSDEPEDTTPDHGMWRLPRIRIEEVK